jgi:DNA-binding Lrp family transcriptional regulator
LAELDGIRTIKGLSENQRKIVSLVNCGLTQAQIAQRLGFSRAYINQQIKKLLSNNLIQRIETHPSAEGIREYTHFYELSQQVKEQVGKGTVPEPFTACRIHNIRLKVKIINQSAAVSIDKRASYSKSWQMRGGARHKFWFSGKAGMPSVTLDVHPKTIVAYVDKKQMIVAKTPAEAEDIGWRAIYQALDQFIELQSKFNVVVETAHTGTVIGKIHGGFVGSDSPVMDEGVRTKNWWIDRSQEAELGPGHPELETDLPGGMTRLDNLIKVSEQVDLTSLPEMFQNIVNPIAANVLQVQAMMQGSITNQQMLENVTKLISSVLVEMQSIRQENAELKAKLGMM